ncbi:hypothetical protein [Croceicoccus mobilis]|uniref:hypothetical protein n=2 Tax=Croceicoccus mobilis TaxID=1703339 RepID=UPI000ACD247C|nr:hypothetical protein [Croceicoccus mobilis]
MPNAAIIATTSASSALQGLSSSMAKSPNAPASPGETGEEALDSELFGPLLMALAAMQAAPPAPATAPVAGSDSAGLPDAGGNGGNAGGKSLPFTLPQLAAEAEAPAALRDMAAMLATMTGRAKGAAPAEQLREARPANAVLPAASDADAAPATIRPIRIDALTTRLSAAPAPVPGSVSGPVTAEPIATAMETPTKLGQAAASAEPINSAEPAANDSDMPRPVGPKSAKATTATAADRHAPQGAQPAPATVGPAPSAPVAMTTPIADPAPQPAAQFSAADGPMAAERLGALVEAIARARETSGQPVRATIGHAEFGIVALRLSSEDHGLAATLSSADPDFARAVQAGAATRSGPDQAQSNAQQGQGQNQVQNQGHNLGQNAQGQGAPSHGGQSFAQQHRASDAPAHSRADGAAAAETAPEAVGKTGQPDLTGRRGILA